MSRARTGLEASENDFLTGSNTNLKSVIDTTLAKLSGATIKGNNLWLTIRPSAQRVAMQQLAGKCGAAVALDPRTGAVLTMASQPTFNPNAVESNFGSILRTRAPCSPASPLRNRATDTPLTPGSTFKMITTAAALDSGHYLPNSRFVDKGYCTEYGQKVHNFADQGNVEVFGSVDFLQAFEHSINAVFCEIGQKIGATEILNASKRFGFYKDPPLETPSSSARRAASTTSATSSSTRRTRPRSTSAASRSARENAHRSSRRCRWRWPRRGRERRRDDAAYVVARITSPGGSVIVRTKPHKYKRAIKPSTADAIKQMMQAVVTGGTGTAAQIPGVKVAGKTGTAETGGAGTPNTTWFVAFAPADHPTVAVAVVLQNQRGSGGTTAAPIAKSIMEALLPGGSNH